MFLLCYLSVVIFNLVLMFWTKCSLIHYIAEKTDINDGQYPQKSPITSLQCVVSELHIQTMVVKMVQPCDFQPSDFSRFITIMQLMLA